jgi:hypothetical protein
MGQIFHACAYDIETKTCCVIEADKFHANCYSFSGAVVSMHYLLRQKPYRVMWGGSYVDFSDSDYAALASRTENLLGISTYRRYENFERENVDILEEDYYDKIKFIDDNSKLWTKINVWNEAEEYFDWDNTRSVKYSGYVLNHTQKLAVDLEDYHTRSQFLRKYEYCERVAAIDVVPVLTETGGGGPMALFEGFSADSTEELFESWCGDLLQIVDELPEGYKIIDCCFAELWSRAKYCYFKFGVDENGYVLNDGSGKRFKAARFGSCDKRGPSHYVKAKATEGSKNVILHWREKKFDVGTSMITYDRRPHPVEEVIMNLLANGVSPDIIAESFDLPVKKIQELMPH